MMKVKHRFVFDMRQSQAAQLVKRLPAIASAEHEPTLVIIDKHGIEFGVDTLETAAELIAALLAQEVPANPESRTEPIGYLVETETKGA